jgi:hypothetical protein
LATGTVQFYGEVKKVTSEAGQGTQYREYLAKCYRASKVHDQPYHFMWITWHPFNVGIWQQLCEFSSVKAAVKASKEEYCGDGDIDDTLCGQLATRLWLIVLSDRQETLTMSDEMLGTLRKAIVDGITP